MIELQECDLCGKKIVHPEREYKICLDCMAYELIKKGVLEYHMPTGTFHKSVVV